MSRPSGDRIVDLSTHTVVASIGAIEYSWLDDTGCTDDR